MTYALPPALRQCIDRLADGIPTSDLARHYQAVSDRYRDRTRTTLQIASADEALAYIIARLPATYGAVANVAQRLRASLPDLQPQTLLDIGSGPGTAALAVLSLWPETLHSATALEPNPHLRDLSRTLFDQTYPDVDICYATATLQNYTGAETHDLVTASYVLNETNPAHVGDEVEKLWTWTRQALILIEPGTPLGYEVIMAARDRLLALGANLTAPCPHHLACPLRDTPAWCHFSNRVERSKLHLRIKEDASLGYEDEKFSYVIATRVAPDPIRARLIGHPHGSKIVALELCRADGTAGIDQVSKRDPDYKRARKMDWGDAL